MLKHHLNVTDRKLRYRNKARFRHIYNHEIKQKRTNQLKKRHFSFLLIVCIYYHYVGTLVSVMPNYKDGSKNPKCMT